jgi:hypothetical protein
MFVDKEEHVYRTVLGRNGFHLGAQKGILHKLSSLLDDDDTNATINSKGKVLLLITLYIQSILDNAMCRTVILRFTLHALKAIAK